MKEIKLILILGIIFLANPVYAQKEIISEQKIIPLPKQEIYLKQENKILNKLDLFLEFINKNVYAQNINKDEERKLLREKWEQLLKVDIFYPYFLKKDIENWLSEKTKIEFFNLKGKAEFQDNQIKYIFKIKF